MASIYPSAMMLLKRSKVFYVANTKREIQNDMRYKDCLYFKLFLLEFYVDILTLTDMVLVVFAFFT